MLHNQKTRVAIGLLLIIVFFTVFVIFWHPQIAENPMPLVSPFSTLSSSTQPSASIQPSNSTKATPSSMTPTHNPTLTPAPSSTVTTFPIFNPSVIPILPRPSNSPMPITLYPGEVREYQGQSLSPIGSVYENAIAGIQQIDLVTYKLKINGLVNKTLELSYNDVITGYQHYQKVVTIYCVEGWQATILWEGVLAKDLIQNAGPTTQANTVIFHASDGYTTSLPLDYLVKNNIIIAFKMNDITMPPERGFPFQLVAESKYGYKWIKWITGIELSNDPTYLGYWESRGYSNSADAP